MSQIRAGRHINTRIPPSTAPLASRDHRLRIPDHFSASFPILSTDASMASLREMVHPTPTIFIQFDFKDDVTLQPPKEFETTWKSYDSIMRYPDPSGAGERLHIGWAYDLEHPTTIHVIIASM
jgi:hypothetical protein